MLWKPVSPVYPRLIQRAPEGLTLEEASAMRKKGRELMPICKLGNLFSSIVQVDLHTENENSVHFCSL